MIDPTRSELVAHLVAAYPAVTHSRWVPHPEGACPGGCRCRFNIEEAAYWVAVHRHGGQGSNLYAAQCASPYIPGMTVELPDFYERTTASGLYRDAVEWITGKPFYEETDE